MHSSQARIQERVWRGYGQAALRLGSIYRFYRVGGHTLARPKYDTGKKYDRRLRYDSGISYKSNVGDFDTAGVRFDEGGSWDEPDDPDAVSQTQYDSPGAIWDSGVAFDQPGNLIAELYVSLNAEDMKYGRPNKYGKATWYALVDAKDLQSGDYFIGQQGTFFIAAMQPLLPILAVECNRIVNIFEPLVQTGTGAVGYGGTTGDNMKEKADRRPCSILQGTKGERSEGNLPGDTRSPWWTVLLPDSGIIIEADDILIDDLGHRYVVSSAEHTDLGYRLSCMEALP